MKDRSFLVYVVALTAIAITAIVAGVILAEHEIQRGGAIAVAASCVTAIALLARRAD